MPPFLSPSFSEAVRGAKPPHCSFSTHEEGHTCPLCRSSLFQHRTRQGGTHPLVELVPVFLV